MMDLEREKEMIRDRLLGKSLRTNAIYPDVTLGRDINFESNSVGLDLAITAGVETLNQALITAITTRLGDDVFNTNFGFDGLNALVDEQDYVLMRERVRVSVIQVLRKEPRVSKIIDVKLSQGQLQLTSDGEFLENEELDQDSKSRIRRELNVSVSFETVTKEQVTLSIGEVYSV
ncbi:MAG: hypothetical protein OQK95_05160 [Gammaproteobacteria bacterium]|nr:hypothetical protein [Gammaproteobacteria bacterium]MCW9032400.1 hypothetical protein [Gammaproteobacteria bacterium]